jgi:nifR3 family TIM-barrel protein
MNAMNIGPVHLPVPFLQAGLAGYSDRAMRVVARRRGCPYAVTEALLDVIMLNGGEGLRKSIDIDDEDHPVAGQIIGSEPEQMAKAARILHERGYDVIDLNFACPVKKIKNKARGGHMLRDVPRAVGILKAVRDALPPGATTTVSMRRAFDDSNQAEEDFYRVLEAVWEYGYCAARVHARTVEQKYVGRSRWEVLRRLKEQYPNRTIVGSGDVFTAEDAVRMLRETGVDAVWIARGAIGNPWVFAQAAALNVGATHASPSTPSRGEATTETRAGHAPPLPPTIHEQRAALEEHFALSMEIHGEQLAGRRMRKQGIKYARWHPNAREVKEAFVAVSSLRQWREVLTRFYAEDGPGVWPSADAVDEVNGAGDLQSCETA